MRHAASGGAGVGGGRVAEAGASRDAGGSGAARPAVGGDESTDTEEKVARARNPAEPKPPPDEGQGAETLDLVLEIAALGLLSALLALFLRASFHHPGAVGLGVGLVALLLAALALVRVS